jgi:hypothetical protein
MSSYFAIEAIEPSIKKTTAFFSGPSLFRKWAKLAVLILIFSALSGGGGGGFNGSNSFSTGKDTAASSAQASEMIKSVTDFIAGIDFGTLLLIAIVILIVLFIIGTILNFIKYTAQFSLLEGITTNEVKIFGYAGKFIGRSFSLALFDLLLGIIELPFSILLIAGVLGIVLVFLSALPAVSGIVDVIPYHGLLTNPAFIIAALIIGIPAILFFSLINYIKGQFGVYLMYTRNISSAFSAFMTGAKIAMSNKVQTIVLLLTQFILAIATGIISLIVALIIAIPFVIVIIIGGIIFGMLGAAQGISIIAIIIGVMILLPLIILMAYLISFALAPIQVFLFYYNLRVLENFGQAPA